MGLFGKKKKNKPFVLTKEQKTLHRNLEFTASEQYRLLRTNIKFTLPEDVKCPVIGMTSSTRGEGKSTTVINLSYMLAEEGHKVLLIDGDLRIPSIAKKMNLNASPGLSELLLGDEINIEQLKSSVHDNWYILPSGILPPNPSELLGSRRMENGLNSLKEHFDYIMIDLPPVNLVSDAISMSHLLTGLILVIRENYANKKDLEQCVRQIKLSNVNVLGCVMNESGNDSSKKYKKYNYYQSNEKGSKK